MEIKGTRETGKVIVAILILAVAVIGGVGYYAMTPQHTTPRRLLLRPQQMRRPTDTNRDAFWGSEQIWARSNCTAKQNLTIWGILYA